VSKVLFLALFCCFCLFVTQVSRSNECEDQGQRSKVNVTTDKNARGNSVTPRQQRNGTRLLQMTSHSSGRHHSIAAGGDFGGVLAVYVW